MNKLREAIRHRLVGRNSPITWLVIASLAGAAHSVSGHPRWLMRRAAAFSRARRAEPAIATYLQAAGATNGRRRGVALIEAGSLSLELGDLEGALAAYTELTEVRSFEWKALVGRFEALMRLDRRAEACELLAGALAAADGDVSIRNLRRVARVTERFRAWSIAATAHDLIAERLAPSPSPTMEMRRAQAHARAGDRDLAEQILAGAIARAPESINLRREVARVAAAVGQWGEASHRWSKVIELASEEATAADWAALAMAQRRSGDLDEAELTIQRGRDALTTPGGRLVAEDINCTLMRYRLSGEDSRHWIKERLLGLERELIEAGPKASSSRAALRALSNLQLLTRRWDEALETLEVLEQRYPELSHEVCKKQARAHTQIAKEIEARTALPSGDPARSESRLGLEHYHQAVEALRGADGETPTESLTREQRRLAKHYGRAVSNEVIDLADLRLSAGDWEAGNRLLEAAAMVRGFDQEQLKHVRPLLEDIAMFSFVPTSTPHETTPSAPIRGAERAEAPSPHTEHRDPSRRIVLASGFLYSGSGAVFDYLRTLNGTATPFDAGELWCLQKANNFSEMLLAGERSPLATRKAAFESLLTNILGFRQTSLPLVGHFDSNSETLTEFIELARILAQDVGSISMIETRKERSELLESAIAAFLDGLIALRIPGDDVGLLNNVVPAHKLADQLRLFTGGRAVAVLRDPRDQYVSQRLESPYSRPVRPFVDMMRERYADFKRALEIPGVADRIVTLEFEDFITSSTVRAQVAEAFGLDASQLNSGGAGWFDPEKSRKNIGIHSRYREPAEIEEVETCLFDEYASLRSGTTFSA